MKIFVLTKFHDLGASSRLRFQQYINSSEFDVFDSVISPFITNSNLLVRYKMGSYGWLALLSMYLKRIRSLFQTSSHDFLWIEKEALPFFPVILELFMLRRVRFVLDYDDAVFHVYDQHRSVIIRRLLGRRLDKLMGSAALVVCGNNYLAERARKAGAGWVEILPTVIDLKRYSLSVHSIGNNALNVPRIVWIGSPSTVKYLHVLTDALRELSNRVPFFLRVIGAEFEIDGIQIEHTPWSEDTEVAAISECSVGIMPLIDSQWERGKCGYKLIQYMACGLPVVASDVGVNSEIVKEEVSGFLARSSEDWVNSLERLLTDTEMRKRMGKAGRLRVEEEYCIQKTAPKLAGWLKQVAEGR